MPDENDDRLTNHDKRGYRLLILIVKSIIMRVIYDYIP